MNTVYEWCPECEGDVPLEARLEVQRCPECGTWIVPCAMCQGRKCQGCELEKQARKLNRQENEQEN